jgi:hypothetical protein
MGDAAAEDRVAGVILVEMHRIAVAGDPAEHLDVGVLDDLAQIARHADRDVLDADRAALDLVHERPNRTWRFPSQRCAIHAMLRMRKQQYCARNFRKRAGGDKNVAAPQRSRPMA